MDLDFQPGNVVVRYLECLNVAILTTVLFNNCGYKVFAFEQAFDRESAFCVCDSARAEATASRCAVLVDRDMSESVSQVGNRGSSFGIDYSAARAIGNREPSHFDVDSGLLTPECHFN